MRREGVEYLYRTAKETKHVLFTLYRTREHTSKYQESLSENRSINCSPAEMAKDLIHAVLKTVVLVSRAEMQNETRPR